MRKRKRLKRQMKISHIPAKKALGLLLAATGAIIVIHTVPIGVWYGIGGILIVAMLIYLAM